jgi:hypothetical protein
MKNEYRYRILTADRRTKFAGTDTPSWLNWALAAIAVDYFEGEGVHEWGDPGDERPLWEVFPNYPVFIEEYEPGRFHVWYRMNSVDVYAVDERREPEINEVLFIIDEQVVAWGNSIDLYAITSLHGSFNGNIWDDGDMEDFRRMVRFAEETGYTKIEMDFIPCMGESF